nr:hypothetical protein [Candidatus Cloacimonadota bacterium]
WDSISINIKGNRYHHIARELSSANDWERSSIFYKKSIMNLLNNSGKLSELVNELSGLYKAQGFEYDLNRLLDCPDIIKSIVAGSAKEERKEKLMIELYNNTEKFLNTLPGPKI